MYRNYVDRDTAKKLKLTVATSDSFILRADDTTVLSPTGPGRNSVRIRSNMAYTTHVAVCVSTSSLLRVSAIDILHLDSELVTCQKDAGESNILNLSSFCSDR